MVTPAHFPTSNRAWSLSVSLTPFIVSHNPFIVSSNQTHCLGVPKARCLQFLWRSAHAWITPRAAIAIADKSPTRGQYREKIKRHCCCRDYCPCPLLPWKHDPDDETKRPSSSFVVLRYFMATRDSVDRLWAVLTHAAQAIHKQLVLIWSTRMHLTNGTGALMLRPTRPWHCCFDGRLEGWFNCGQRNSQGWVIQHYGGELSLQMLPPLWLFPHLGYRWLCLLLFSFDPLLIQQSSLSISGLIRLMNTQLFHGFFDINTIHHNYSYLIDGPFKRGQLSYI